MDRTRNPALCSERWTVPYALAVRIACTPPPKKPQAVRCWSAAVQAALQPELWP